MHPSPTGHSHKPFSQGVKKPILSSDITEVISGVTVTSTKSQKLTPAKLIPLWRNAGMWSRVQAHQKTRAPTEEWSESTHPHSGQLFNYFSVYWCLTSMFPTGFVKQRRRLRGGWASEVWLKKVVIESDGGVKTEGQWSVVISNDGPKENITTKPLFGL